MTQDLGAPPCCDRAGRASPRAGSRLGHSATIASAWEPIETAPKDHPVLVWYDHAADPYQDLDSPGKLTAYACHAEGGDFMDGSGITIAHWCEGYEESNGWEAGDSYWMPAVWCVWHKHDFSEAVVNPVFWMPLPDEPAQAIDARSGETGTGSISEADESAVPNGDAP